MSNQSQSDEFNDEGLSRPIPSFDASGIKLGTIAPALGVADDDNTPDYLVYEGAGNRGISSTMFSNAGLSYMIGTFGGGVYGLRQGLASTPSTKFRIRLNSVLNNCSRHGGRIGNMAGSLSLYYSLYEYAGDQFNIENYTGPLQPAAPAIAAFMTGFTYQLQAGPRVAALAGTIGLGFVGATYAAYTVLGIPYGQKGWLFF